MRSVVPLSPCDVFSILCISEGTWKLSRASKCYIRPQGSPWGYCEEFFFFLHSSLMITTMKYLRHGRKIIFSFNGRTYSDFVHIRGGPGMALSGLCKIKYDADFDC